VVWKETNRLTDYARCEVFEEMGLTVELGKSAYLCQFLESANGTHHLEVFFQATAPSGVLTIANIVDNGPDEHIFKGVALLGREELASITVYPECLRDRFWDDLKAEFPETPYLGLNKEWVR
jgi:ADP-ribose pyrophosphatase YjhB (NUDIX family)